MHWVSTVQLLFTLSTLCARRKEENKTMYHLFILWFVTTVATKNGENKNRTTLKSIWV